MRIAAVIAFVLTAGCVARSPTEPSPTPLTVALDASRWETISDPQPFSLSNQGAALTFEFPSTGSMHYLYTASTLAEIHGTLVVSLSVTTSGPVIFNSLDPQTAQCSLPSAVRPFFWSNGNGEGPYDRWWSNPVAYVLANGSTTLSVPLKPANWSSVNGRLGNASGETSFNFEKALLNVTRLGLTFGGGCSFGHGINIRGGSASFSLTGYRVQ